MKIPVRKYQFLFWGIACLLISCSEPAGPTGLLPHTEFKSILTELQLSQAAIELKNAGTDSSAFLTTVEYHSILDRHHTNSAQFRNTYEYYLTQPALMDTTLKQIVNDLIEMEAANPMIPVFPKNKKIPFQNHKK